MYNGNYYGKPLTSDPYILFYNKDAMDTKGLSVPSSWSSFMETAEKIAAKGSYGFGFAARDSEESARFFMLMLYAKQGIFIRSSRMQVFLLLLGTVVSFAVSILAIKFLMQYIRKH